MAEKVAQLTKPVNIQDEMGDLQNRQKTGTGEAIREKSVKAVKKVVQKCAAIAVVLILWEVLPRCEFIDPFLLPSLSSVLESLWRMVLTGELFKHIGASLTRSLAGFTIAVTFSIIAGYLIGWFKRAERLMSILMEVGRNTSTLALYPVFILIFGLGELSKIAIITFGAIWPTLLNTISGVRNVDPLVVKMARSMGLSRVRLFYKVLLPMTLPSIAVGFRLSAASSLLILVASEMLGANKGLGFMVFYYQERYAIPEMYGGILMLAVVGVLVNFLLVKLEGRLTFWKERAVK